MRTVLRILNGEMAMIKGGPDTKECGCSRGVRCWCPDFQIEPLPVTASSSSIKKREVKAKITKATHRHCPPSCTPCYGTDEDKKALKRIKDSMEVEEVLDAAFKKYTVGIPKYGGLNLSGRDFFEEAEQELLDAINYLAFEVIRIRRRRNKRGTDTDKG